MPETKPIDLDDPVPTNEIADRLAKDATSPVVTIMDGKHIALVLDESQRKALAFGLAAGARRTRLSAMKPCLN